jgi:ankyrin repeat protein
MFCKRCAVGIWFLLLGSLAVASPRAQLPLIAAVKEGNLSAIRSLIEHRADVNAREVDGTTALHWATQAGNVPVVDVLIAAGADVNAVSRYGATALALAARQGNAALLRGLLRAGADLLIADSGESEGQTLLMHASHTGSVDAILLLVDHGADVNARERRTGTTALMWAAIEDRPEAITALLAAGAEIDARSTLTQYPHTPPAVVGDPLEEGASYVGQTVLAKGGWTALMYAARQGARGAVRVLAESGADLDVTDPDGSSALMFAIINGHYDVATLLAESGADVNLADRTGMTPLYAAVDMHTLPTTFGRPDLTPSVVAGSIGAVKMLLTYGADPNARLKTKILKRVYNPGDPRLGEGATPFMRAARGGDVVAMRLLYEAGADPRLAQQNGNTPIHLAVSASRGGNNPDRSTDQGAMQAIAYSLELGVDINATNSAGDTALHLSLTAPAIVEFLIGHGASRDVKNRQGQTPLEAAMRSREPNDATIALLRRANAPEAGSK